MSTTKVDDVRSHTDASDHQAWPFLVGRGRKAGYQVIAAPEFLLLDHDIELLESEELLHDGGLEPTVATVSSKRGNLSAVVMSERITNEALGVDSSRQDQSEAVLDRHGRPLRITYGFAVQSNAVAEVASSDLARSRQVALDAYRRYLASGEPLAPQSTTPFVAESSVVPLSRSRLPTVLSRRVLVGIGAAVVVALWIVFRSLAGGSGSPTEASPTTPEATAAITPYPELNQPAD